MTNAPTRPVAPVDATVPDAHCPDDRAEDRLAAALAYLAAYTPAERTRPLAAAPLRYQVAALRAVHAVHELDRSA